MNPYLFIGIVSFSIALCAAMVTALVLAGTPALQAIGLVYASMLLAMLTMQQRACQGCNPTANAKVANRRRRGPYQYVKSDSADSTSGEVVKSSAMSATALGSSNNAGQSMTSRRSTSSRVNVNTSDASALARKSVDESLGENTASEPPKLVMASVTNLFDHTASNSAVSAVPDIVTRSVPVFPTASIVRLQPVVPYAHAARSHNRRYSRSNAVRKITAGRAGQQ